MQSETEIWLNQHSKFISSFNCHHDAIERTGDVSDPQTHWKTARCNVQGKKKPVHVLAVKGYSCPVLWHLGD